MAEPLAIPCPICGARTGRACVAVVNGRPVRELPASRSHRERVHLAAEDPSPVVQLKETPTR